MGIRQAFPIQEQTYNLIKERNDVIGTAKNGTGKTLAILLPCFSQITMNYKGIQTLIVSNTHENEDQIYNTAKAIIQNLPENSIMKQLSINTKDRRHKGQKINGQIIVTSISQALYLVKKSKNIKQIYFDEYDSYFTPKNEQLLREMLQIMYDKNIQGVWFSATPNRYTNNLITEFLSNPYQINVTEQKQMLIGLKQYIAQCTEQNKKRIVVQVLKQLKIDQCIIFCNEQQQEELKEYIESQTGIPSIIVKNDEERQQSYQDFCNRKYRICIASNLISRGMDNRCVNIVINYDVPRSYSLYVQRCGRAGRAGHYGMTLTLVTQHSQEQLMKILQVGKLNIGEDIKELPAKLSDVDHSWEYDQDDIVF